MIYSKSPDVVFRKIADEYVLVPIRQKASDLQSIYTLNDTAAFVWESIDGAKDILQIRDKMLEEFEVESSQAEPDIIDILSQLEELSFIKKA